MLTKLVISAGRSSHIIFNSFLDGVNSLSLSSFNTNKVPPTTFSMVHPPLSLDSPWISSELRSDEPGMTFSLEVKGSADITEVCITLFNVSCYKSVRTAVKNVKIQKENHLMKKSSKQSQAKQL